MKKLCLSVLALASSMVVAQAQTLADYANKGDAALANQQYQEAVDNYVKAQELDTDNTDYLTAFQLATAYDQLGESQKAGEAYKASIIKGNTDPGVITNMKNAFETAGCTECVKNAYLEIKAANPDQTTAMDRKLYFIYVKEKDWQSAVNCCQTILADPATEQEEQVSNMKRSAQCYLNLNQVDSAEVYYEKVLAITPNDADIHKALGYACYNNIQRTIQSAQNSYKALGSKATSHDFSVMQTTTKRVTLAQGPKAIEHLTIANKTLNDPQITSVISKLRQNIAAYQK
jgi:tetratricopeptide (TPR) repeat protein